jgi:hypothetical protein
MTKPTGRPPGRPPGRRNKKNDPHNKVIADARAKFMAGLTIDEIDVLTPLDIMLRIMRTAWRENDLVTVKEMAKEAAPYVHAKLSSTKVDANVSLFDRIPINQQRALVEALAALSQDEGDAEAGATETHH